MRAIVVIAFWAAACGSSNPRYLKITGPDPVLDVQAGATLQLTATLTDSTGAAYALPGAVTWSSSNPAVATVDPASGLVTAVAQGVTSVMATSGGQSSAEWLSVGASIVQWSLTAGTAGVTTTIPAGTPLRWHAADMTHTVNATVAPPPESMNVPQGTTSDPAVFATPGRYTYRCAIHPSMTGTIVVQ
jgi:plastocyanin